MMKGFIVGAIAVVFALLVGMFGITTPLIANALEVAQGASTAATATVQSTDGSAMVLGEATFTETPEGLKVDLALSDVPTGFHGFHVHQFGSCDEGGVAAGGHFNPDGVKHGYLLKDGYDAAHVGDLGNVVIYSNGSGTISVTLPDLPLTDGDRAIAGHAVILHADRDDFGQPTGNAGGRIGCGIIELAS
ncbi:MAG: superoxide dismutase family protein [Cyanobacteria bacterium P01_E01_bin.6]